MTRRKLSASRILVTGASSGIGSELARRLAARSARLLITARRQQRLDVLRAELQAQFPNARIERVAGDITQAETRRQLADAAVQRLGGLDILINNAGIGAIGPFVESNEDTLRRVMEVNFFAMTELTRHLIPLLQRGHKPLIVNVGSVLGHRAVPLKNEYCASKFAVHGWSDALRCELSREGIDVFLASPSTTASEFFDQAVRTDHKAESKSLSAMPASIVAEKIVRGMERGRREVILSWGGKALVVADRLFPGRMDWILSRFAQ